MKRPSLLAVATRVAPNAIHPACRRHGILLISLLSGCLALARIVSAADGGLSGGNTSEGDNALNSLTTGVQNTAMGFNALRLDQNGGANTAMGWQALVKNNSGRNNTGVGSEALQNNTTGNNNTASGFTALLNNNGNNNTATGVSALQNNRNGASNTATGLNALRSNTTGGSNTATGASALFSNTVGSDNTAVGFGALHSNAGNGFQREATLNTAVGSGALFNNTTGFENTAMGFTALGDNQTGILNTAVGSEALNNSSADYNTAVGWQALIGASGSHNTAVGERAYAGTGAGNRNTIVGGEAYGGAGDDNIAIGYQAGIDVGTGGGSDNIEIGNAGMLNESDIIRIGAGQTATFIAGIYGQSVDTASGVPVQIDSSGKLGTVLSSARFKQAIEPMDKSSEALLALEPVTFQYKPELDPKGVPQFGLVAEQVEKVAPELVVHDKQGKPYTVRYEAVNAMLLNEFLKEHKKAQIQDRKMLEQGTTIAQMKKQVEALTATVQKVSDQLERSKAVPQLVSATH